MREINRIDRISNKLSILWHEYPDQRLGQLLENYIFEYCELSPLFYLEDDIIEDKIDAQIDFKMKISKKK